MTTDDFGGYPPSLRWNAETDELECIITNEVFEKEPQPIPLNSSASTFVMDMLRRERGIGHIETGVFEMLLAPVGQEIPPMPPGADQTKYKGAIGVDVWNPKFGLLRLETTGAYFKAAIGRIWKEYGSYEEGARGLLPVIRFVGSRAVSPKKYPNKVYHSPTIHLVGWLPREKVPEFAAKEPTVPLPVLVQNDSEIAAALRARLEAPRRETPAPKSKKTGRPSRLEDDLDDSLPDDDVEGV
jgi:hypothetical protein